MRIIIKKRMKQIALLLMLLITLCATGIIVMYAISEYYESVEPSEIELKNEDISRKLKNILRCLPSDSVDSNNSCEASIEQLILSHNYTENDCRVLNNVFYLESSLRAYRLNTGSFPDNLDTVIQNEMNMLQEGYKYDDFYFPMFYKGMKNACIIGSFGANKSPDFNNEQLIEISSASSNAMFFFNDDIFFRLSW